MRPIPTAGSPRSKTDEAKDQEQLPQPRKEALPTGNITVANEEHAREESDMETADEDSDEEVLTEESSEKFVVLMELNEQDRHIIRCPIELNEFMQDSFFENLSITDVRTNYYRGVIAIELDNENDAQQILNLTTLNNRTVSCKRPQGNTKNVGVVGPIPCPMLREDMERKAAKYKEWIERDGKSVKTLGWIKKKVWETGVRGHKEEISQFIRIEFNHPIPDYIFLGSQRYGVEPYVEDVTQCYKCQKTGHIAKNCKSITVCSFCSKKGHRKSDNVCRTRSPRCANCEGPHPSTYRGCIAFKREKLAKTLQAKKNKTIYEARKIASRKQFPSLIQRNRQQSTGHSQTRQSVSYAQAVSPVNTPQEQSGLPLNPSAPVPRPAETGIAEPAPPSQGITETRTSATANSAAAIALSSHGEDLINDLVSKILKETLTKIFSKLGMLMLKIVQATSIDAEGKMDIMTTGMKSIINQILPEGIDNDIENMSFIDDWMESDDDTPQAKEKNSVPKWVTKKNRGRRKRRN